MVTHTIPYIHSGIHANCTAQYLWVFVIFHKNRVIIALHGDFFEFLKVNMWNNLLA